MKFALFAGAVRDEKQHGSSPKELQQLPIPEVCGGW